jgi:hypothetical protein
MKRRERGMVAIIVALSMTAVLLVVATVVDLGALRSDRQDDQRAADAAATAGALALPVSGGQAACTAAMGYLAENLPSAGSFTGVNCSTFPSVCTSTTAAVSATGTAGDYVVRIVHPVPNNHDLMASPAVGRPRPTVHSMDGQPCERIAVEVSLAREPFFAGVAGAGESTTTVHAVAIAEEETGSERPINLLVLERRRCRAIHVSGGGDIVVEGITDPVTGVVQPGIMAVDSDGSESCDGGAGTLDVDGSPALARADGPTGCVGELMAGTGQACGIIELYAAGVPGNNDFCDGSNELPACQSTGTVRPSPVRTSELRTRAPIDYRYNCKPSYALEPWYARQPIVGCSDGTPAYIDDLKAYATSVASGTVTGWNVYGDTASEPCTIDAAPVTLSVGNWYVNCNRFLVRQPVTFAGGNVVFDGDVVIEGGTGHLTLNQCTSLCPVLSFLAGGDFAESSYSADAAWAVFRTGDGLRKAGQAQLTVNDAVLVFADTGCAGSLSNGDPNGRCLQLEGGSGALRWTAPREGPFDDLALWSEGTLNHDFGGQATMSLEGVLFAPSATVVYRGNGNQQQVQAQFVSERLHVNGNGTLFVRPVLGRSVDFPNDPRATIIR